MRTVGGALRAIGWMLTAAALATLAPAGTARAGDRGFYVAVAADPDDSPVSGMQREALERSLFLCAEDETLDACRAARVPGGDRDTSGEVLVAPLESAIEPTRLRAARQSPRGRTALIDALNDRGVALDGVLLVRNQGGVPSLVAINLSNRTVTRFALHRNGSIAEGHRTRLLRFLSRGFRP